MLERRFFVIGLYINQNLVVEQQLIFSQSERNMTQFDACAGEAKLWHKILDWTTKKYCQSEAYRVSDQQIIFMAKKSFVLIS